MKRHKQLGDWTPAEANALARAADALFIRDENDERSLHHGSAIYSVFDEILKNLKRIEDKCGSRPATTPSPAAVCSIEDVNRALLDGSLLLTQGGIPLDQRAQRTPAPGPAIRTPAERQATAPAAPVATQANQTWTRNRVIAAAANHESMEGADLRGTNLSDANLSRANLSRANLSRANLSRANLSRANLSNANLRGVDLSGADLSNADLCSAVNFNRSGGWFGTPLHMPDDPACAEERAIPEVQQQTVPDVIRLVEEIQREEEFGDIQTFIERNKKPIAIAAIVAIAGGVFFLARRGSAMNKPRMVVAIGDSLTAAGKYVLEVVNQLPPGSSGKSYGYVGKGVKYILGKVPEALKNKPTDVIVLAGVNDIASGRNIKEIQGGLVSIYQAVKASGARLVAVKPTPWAGYPTFKGNASRTAQIADFISASTLPDVVVDPSSLGDAAGNLLKVYSRDGLHMSDAGYAALGKLIAEKAF